MKKLLLIDGNSMAFKAFYGTAYGNGDLLRALDGTPTNAVFAFANMLSRFLNEHDYAAVYVCFDKGKKTFRHELMGDYKGGRSKTPTELIVQFPIIKEFLSAYGIPYWELDNYEADDLIGCLAQKGVSEGYDVDIMSSDKDLFQLINEHVKVLVTRQGVSNIDVYDEAKLWEKWQVKPHQVPELKGLMGDPSDNLKGIPNVGEKTAIKLINEYQTIENIYAHASELTKALSEKVTTHIEAAYLCRQLATIVCDLEMNHITLSPININVSALEQFYAKYNMHSLAMKLPASPEVTPIVNPTPDITVVKTASLEQFTTTGINTIYLELFEENYHTSPIIGMGWANTTGQYYIEFEDLKRDTNIRGFLENPVYNKLTYDLKKVLCALRNYGIEVQGIIDDTMLASYVVNPNVKNSLDTYAQLFLNETIMSDDEFFNRGVKKSIPADVLKVAEFIGHKVDVISRLMPVLEGLLVTNQQEFLYREIELPCAFALSAMETNGIAVDLVELDYQTSRIAHVVQSMQQQIINYAGYEVNPNSPKQLKELLYQQLGLPDTKKGSTAQEVLEGLASQHPIIPVILDYRKYQKLYSTYLLGMKKYLFADNKVHTIYKQTLTATGRLSSIEPNMQNISVHDPIQKEVRKIFVPGEANQILMSCDYSQIELRVLAHMSGDEHMIAAFNNGEDIHTNTAMKVFGLSREQVDDNYRRKAKAINFGIIYGISDFGLATDLNISVGEAKTIIANYYAQFPTIKNFINQQVEFCKDHGYVTTMFNRKRYVPEITDRNYMTREFGKRVAMNMPIQGTAADIIKLALNKVAQAFRDLNLKSKITAQIHDELIFEVVDTERELVKQTVINAMEGAVSLAVKLKVDTNFGKNWYDIK